MPHFSYQENGQELKEHNVRSNREYEVEQEHRAGS